MGITRRWLFTACRFVVLAGLIATATPASVYAQDAIPTIEDAELVFGQGVDAFESGDYETAHRRFRVVFETYELNRKTTAALLMAAKALYRADRFEEAVDLSERLIEEYPSSGYLEEARRVRRLANGQLDREAARREPREIGVLLPLRDDDATLSQALFTGVRIAVDEHNRLNEEHPVRLVFRDTYANPSRAPSLVRELAAADVDVLNGPLYSSEAMAAAEAAELARVVLVAPLANNEAVSEGREYVFQANPTFTMRGRLMARFAMRGLLLDNFGIIAERDPEQISERMAEGFQDELMLSGKQTHYYRLLQSQNDWGQLADTVGADTLGRAEAVYLPIAGGESIARIDAALSSFDRMGMSNQIRVLGNTEWHDAPNASRASRYATTYSNDFYVEGEDASVRAFSRRFEVFVG
ncbi:MAG: ABC transporter substrate-binding protein [Rhodothermales bacterium]